MYRTCLRIVPSKRGGSGDICTPTPIHHCFRVAFGGIKSLAPLACREGLLSMIPGQRRLSGSVVGAHSRKSLASVDLMRAQGMWAPRVQLHRYHASRKTLIPPQICSLAWKSRFLSSAVPSVYLVLKLTHPGARLQPLTPLPAGLAQLLQDEERWNRKVQCFFFF